MLRKKTAFRFFPYNNNEYTNVVPSKTTIPKWYKDTKQFVTEKPFKNAMEIGRTVKVCVPFLEALTAGYVMVTSYDLVVAQINDTPVITWAEGGDVLLVRDSRLNETLPIPPGHSSIHFVWTTPATFTVPEGYSVLVTQPLNRYDLPFTTLSGILDGPYVLGVPGQIPFFLRTGFEGVIPQGTPFAQLIPFKQEGWKLQQDKSLEKEAEMNAIKSRSILTGWYKKNYWQKKRYE